MKIALIGICALSLTGFAACNRDNDELPDPTTGYIEYIVNGNTYRYDDAGSNASAASVYDNGDLQSVGLTGGSGGNSIIISDYISDATGTTTITEAIAENEDFVVILNVEGSACALFWGGGTGVDTGTGTITYDAFEPGGSTGPAQLSGSFSFTVYDLAGNPVPVTGNFSF